MLAVRDRNCFDGNLGTSPQPSPSPLDYRCTDCYRLKPHPCMWCRRKSRILPHCCRDRGLPLRSVCLAEICFGQSHSTLRLQDLLTQTKTNRLSNSKDRYNDYCNSEYRKCASWLCLVAFSNLAHVGDESYNLRSLIHIAV